MKIVICGLGYVGSTVAACLVEANHEVVGIDIEPWKVERIAAGISPVAEPRLTELLTNGLNAGRLQASTRLGDQLDTADMVFVCVSTPTSANGALNLSAVVAVTGEIAAAIRRRPPGARRLLVVYRSTLPPGTMENVIIPILEEKSGLKAGTRYEPVFNPEFLREATAVEDYRAPSRIVIGERHPGASQRMFGIYDHIDAPYFEMSLNGAEFIKLCDNSFHALKVAFGNEIGRVCLGRGIEPAEVIDAFLADSKLNISTAYLRPGSPFGGSCLTKDLRAMIRVAAQCGADTPLLRGVLGSNEAHKSFMLERVRAAAEPGARILLVGLAFKPNTDDLRESPYVDLAVHLLEDGYKLHIYDPLVDRRSLVGMNLRSSVERLPSLHELMVVNPVMLSTPDLILMAHPKDPILQRLDPHTPRINLNRIESESPASQVSSETKAINTATAD